MSERDGFQAGVPCWVESIQLDAEAGRDFYGGLFGWEFEGSGPIEDGPAGEYFVARLRGRDVAGVAPAPRDFDFPRAAWTTQVQVEDVEATGAKATAAGGSILAGPFDFDEVGRLLVIADPQGASLGVWEPGLRKGAQIVNESNAWAMSALSTSDTAAAAEFYGSVFDWTTETFGEEGPDSISMFRLPGFVGGEPQQPVSREVVATMVSSADTQSSWVPDFWVDDVDESISDAGRLGGKAEVGPYDTPVGRMAVMSDPQGGVFSISTITAVAAERKAAEEAAAG
ncbi:VOC family protein [soil metagenome]